jgi:hypothetical protein
MNSIWVKELRPALAFRSNFSSLKAKLVQDRKSNPATSIQVKRTHRCQGQPQFLNLDKIHQILVKKHLNNMSQ